MLCMNQRPADDSLQSTSATTSDTAHFTRLIPSQPSVQLSPAAAYAIGMAGVELLSSIRCGRPKVTSAAEASSRAVSRASLTAARRAASRAAFLAVGLSESVTLVICRALPPARTALSITLERRSLLKSRTVTCRNYKGKSMEFGQMHTFRAPCAPVAEGPLRAPHAAVGSIIANIILLYQCLYLEVLRECVPGDGALSCLGVVHLGTMEKWRCSMNDMAET